MDTIDALIVHCSATKEGMDFSAADIDRWHRARGFVKIGYHYVVRLDGTLEKGRAENEIGAHCRERRMNYHSIGICYIGGLDRDGNPADTRTPAQKKTLLHLLGELRSRYPEAIVYGHRDFSPKACPCFDARTEYAGIILPAAELLDLQERLRAATGREPQP